MKGSIAFAAVAAVVALSAGSPVLAQTRGAISCTFDGLTAADRALAFRITTEVTPQAEVDMMNAAFRNASNTCATMNGWVTAKKNSALRYAVSKSILDGAIARLAAANFPENKLRGEWTALSSEEKTKLLADPIPNDFVQLMGLRMLLSGVEQNNLGLSILALSEITKQSVAEQAW